MTRLTGRHLEAFLAERPSQALRDLVGARLFELFYFQILVLQTLHADPHWGNYLFHPDGSLGLVDFGCVKQFEPGIVARLRRSFLYGGSTASPEFQQIIHDQFAAPGRTLSPATRRAIGDFSDRFYRKVYPVETKAAARPVDFSDASFLRDYVRQSSNLFRAKGTAPHYIFLARAEIGLYQTLHRLKARVRTSAILRRLLDANP
jgi:predicted unusual protein kinase regulating ubiquinone biosynthesis (AarF/ABC1/UbiB family)